MHCSTSVTNTGVKSIAKKEVDKSKIKHRNRKSVLEIHQTFQNTMSKLMYSDLNKVQSIVQGILNKQKNEKKITNKPK